MDTGNPAVGSTTRGFNIALLTHFGRSDFSPIPLIREALCNAELSCQGGVHVAEIWRNKWRMVAPIDRRARGSPAKCINFYRQRRRWCRLSACLKACSNRSRWNFHGDVPSIEFLKFTHCKGRKYLTNIVNGRNSQSSFFNR